MFFWGNSMKCWTQKLKYEYSQTLIIQTSIIFTCFSGSIFFGEYYSSCIWDLQQLFSNVERQNSVDAFPLMQLQRLIELEFISAS